MGQAVLERYLALEQEIAQAEQGSPTMVLQHKKNQIAQLDDKITQQKEVVTNFEQLT